MRLAVTSDLHLPITSFARIGALVHEIAEFKPDVLVAAGDIGESTIDIEACLRTLKRVGCPVLVLAGNHDVWCRDAPSRELWEEILPEITRSVGCVWLEGNVFVRDGVSLAGTIAWYDYSGADPTVQSTPENFARQKGNYNNDAFLIDWAWSDIEFAQHVAGPFLAALDRLEADPAVRQIIVVSHVPLLECQMLRKPHDRAWAFSNAYFGNLTLGREVLVRHKVTHIISGHTHVGCTAKIQAPDGRTVDAHVLASEYRRPAWLGMYVNERSA